MMGSVGCRQVGAIVNAAHVYLQPNHLNEEPDHERCFFC